MPNAALRLIIAFALMVTTSSTVFAATPALAPQIAGGWSELAPTDPDLRAVAKVVVPRLPRRHARLLRVEGGERQVVAGMNYRIVLQLKDRSRWRAQVWRKLDGSYEVTRTAQIR